MGRAPAEVGIDAEIGDPFGDLFADTFAGTFPSVGEEAEEERVRHVAVLLQSFKRRRVRVVVEAWEIVGDQEPTIVRYEVRRPWERSFLADARALAAKWTPGRSDHMPRLPLGGGQVVGKWVSDGGGTLLVAEDRRGEPAARGVCAGYLFRGSGSMT